MRIKLATLTLVAAALAGCGDGATSSGGAAKVVATTGVAADFVRAVGGKRVDVTTLIPVGADPHAYEPRPRDLEALADTKLVVRSGGEIDEWLDGAIESAGAKGTPSLTLLDAADRGGAAPPADAGTEAGHGGDVDPHWWHSPREATFAATELGNALGKADPDGAEDYRRMARAYVERLRALDEAISDCVSTIPLDNRKLVTSHDALGYYARRYGFDIVGTVIPARTTQARPAAGSVAKLVATIKRERVPAIFAEDTVNPKVERAIAKESGARIGGELYADGLGPRGSEGSTYRDALVANTRAIVAGLGGDLSRCKLP